MTPADIIHKIEAYEAQERKIRLLLAEAPASQRAELERMLRIKTVALFGLTHQLERTAGLGPARGSHRAAADTEGRA